MYILVENQSAQQDAKHVQYVLRGALEEYIVDVYEQTATIQHRALGVFNITGKDGDDLTPDAAMVILQKLVKHLRDKGELINLCDFPPL